MPRIVAAYMAFAFIIISLLLCFLVITILWFLKFWALVAMVVIAVVYWLARPLIDWIQKEL